MDDTISNVYNELLDRGISITDLYIYDYLINDGCVGHEEDIERLMTKIKNNYANDYEYRSLAYHIEAVLNGEDDSLWD